MINFKIPCTSLECSALLVLDRGVCGVESLSPVRPEVLLALSSKLPYCGYNKVSQMWMSLSISAAFSETKLRMIVDR